MRPCPGVQISRRTGKLVALALAGNRVETWTFDVCTNTWTQMHPNQEPSDFDSADLVYDVDTDVTMLVSYCGSVLRVWAYDLQANAWTEIRLWLRADGDDGRRR